MCQLISIYDLEPDYRRDPKTDFFCCLCQRDIKGKAAGWLHFVEGGHLICKSEDSLKFEGTAGDVGCHPLGPECAKKVSKMAGPEYVIQIKD